MSAPPKQPSNAYILFMQREKQKAGDQKIDRNVISEKWEAMPADQKKVATCPPSPSFPFPGALLAHFSGGVVL